MRFTPPLRRRLRHVAALGTLISAAGAAPHTPPDDFALGDARHAAWAENVTRPPVAITGRITGLPATPAAPLEISGSLVTAGADSQIAHTTRLADDGTFRLAVAATFPRQQVWFRVGRLFYAGLLVRDGVHLEIDAATGAVALTGPDGPLNAEVREFQFRFHKTRQNEIEQALREHALAPEPSTLAARLAPLAELHRESLALVDAFAPRLARHLLVGDCDAEYFTAVLRTARGHEAELAASPLWPRIAGHITYALTNAQTDFYRTLHGFLRRWLAGDRVSGPEIVAELAEFAGLLPAEVRALHAEALALVRPAADTPEAAAHLQATLHRLADTGWMTPVPTLIRRIAAADPAILPRPKLEFALLFALPPDAAAAMLGHAALDRSVTTSWIRTWLQERQAAAGARLAAIDATLAPPSAAGNAGPATPPATDPLGPPLRVLPSGARLHRLPDLAGAEVLRRLRAAYPGRALLLDFWGPWCAPCLDDLPFSRAAHAALRDEPIVFVYLACRTEAGAWQRSVAELKLDGTHLLLENAQATELMALFGLGGFPGYAFIDRHGRHEPGVLARFARTSVETLRSRLR